MGIRGKVSRATLADANEKRDWRIYAEFAQNLIATARVLYKEDSFFSDLDETVYAFDSTTVDLCLSVFPWAVCRQRKATSQNKKLWGNLRECGEVPNLDCCISLCACVHNEKATQSQRKPLHNSTNSKCIGFRKTNIYQLVTDNDYESANTDLRKQLKLYEY